jgi:hypothetical protein
MRGGYALPVSDNEDELSDIGRLDNSDLDG